MELLAMTRDFIRYSDVGCWVLTVFPLIIRELQCRSNRESGDSLNQCLATNVNYVPQGFKYSAYNSIILKVYKFKFEVIG